MQLGAMPGGGLENSERKRVGAQSRLAGEHIRN